MKIFNLPLIFGGYYEDTEKKPNPKMKGMIQMKKTMSLLLSLVLVFMFSAVAFGATYITEAQAKEKALQAAGVSADLVSSIYAKIDYDDGVAEWEVEFTVGDTVGFLEYEYTLDAATGRVTDFSVDAKGGAVPPASGEMISSDTAFNNAKLAVGATDAQLLKCELDRDDGTAHYEVKFRVGTEAKYECEVNAYTGEVREVEVEYYQNAVSKISILIEILLAFFENFFR